MTSSVPGWQTDELRDEWPDSESDEDGHGHDLSYGTQSVSLTIPLSSEIHSTVAVQSDAISSSDKPDPRGTFIVREDVVDVPLLPKTPGRNKNPIKDFFTPLPLERMFEPPSPSSPVLVVAEADLARIEHFSGLNLSSLETGSGSQKAAIETGLPITNNLHGHKTTMECQFTFTVPRVAPAQPSSISSGVLPQAQSTPNPPLPTRTAPATDPRLRLFQFQYDTYTREHLSALVDSIAVNTPSGTGTGTTPTPTSFFHGTSRVRTTPSSGPHIRSSKRVKLSPLSDFREEKTNDNVSVTRPILKDYIGESRSLMQQIKLARDYSTISTVVSASNKTMQDDTHEKSGVERTSPGADSQPFEQRNPATLSERTYSRIGTYSSSSYRQKAAALMEQIKIDVKGHKRIFSGDSEHTNSQVADTRYPNNSREHGRQPNSHRRKSSRHGVSRSSYDSKQVIITLTPPTVITSLNVAPQSPSQKNQVQQQMTLKPPPHSSIGLGANDDLNRFVSSSTASGSTLTSGSVPSFVKHAGPAQIRTIAPSDLPALPERFGDMYYDKALMKWVKGKAAEAEQSNSRGNELSEDPFGDFESLRDESRTEQPEYLSSPDTHDDLNAGLGMAMHSEVEDEEEMELSNFSVDSLRVVQAQIDAAALQEYEEGTTDSESTNDDIHTATQAFINDFDSELEDSPRQTNLVLNVEAGPWGVAGFEGRSPQRFTVMTAHTGTGATATPVIKSALKSNSATPTSALRNGGRSRFQTPNTNAHRRSVSFSDGKRDGPMRDVEIGGGPSVRTKRIADMMAALEDFDLDDSPSKTSSAGRPETLQPLTSRKPVDGPSTKKTQSPRRVFSRTYSYRQSPGEKQNANDTFLTECSFGVARDRLVEILTDIEPFEPHWEQLASVDLSNAKLESVARLKEFLPRLDTLNLSNNELAWLSGIPNSVRTLSLASNRLSSITSYGHLLNLENLDISLNEVDSLRQLECLRHLRELKADGNKIKSLNGLERMDGLVKLSVERNEIQTLDLEQFSWTRLQMLNICHNRINNLHGLSSLPSLIAVNMDSNSLTSLVISGRIPRLRILRVSGNRLRSLDVDATPNLRTLYADSNSLSGIANLHKLRKLENLSLRNQSGRGLKLLTRDVRDVKRLYLSGNPLGEDFLQDACYNLIYLELAACRLSILPEGMAKLLPNLRVLNLNYNFLEDVRPLEGLRRLRKLTIIGSRLKSTKPLIRLVAEMPDAEMLDFRMNPCTLGWYLPLLVKDAPGALQPSEKEGEGWQELDSKFRRDLPDEGYIGRLAYRGLIMRGCRGLRLLDGVGISEKERKKAEELLVGILGRRGR